MSSMNTIIKTVPVLRVNHRASNLDFYCQTLGMKNLLEEGAIVSLGDQSKTEKLMLEESPSMNFRKAESPKKLALIVLRVADAREIEALLAQNKQVEKIYQGVKGYAFEALSPEGDRFLLHAENDAEQLKEVQEPEDFQPLDGFSGLSRFEIEKIILRVPNRQVSQAFYQAFLPQKDLVAFEEAKGADLLAESSLTWDLSMFKFLVTDFNPSLLQAVFKDSPVFVPKSKKFFLTEDKSHIELWFEEA